MSVQQKSGTKPGQPALGGQGQAKKDGKCRGGCAHPVPKTKPVPQTQQAEAVINDDKEESLRKENLELKAQQKGLETKLNELEIQLEKTNLMNVRLEGLCSELKNRTKALTTESNTKIQDAEDRGKTLTGEVSQNLDLMNNINDSIQQITQDNLDSRKFNENLSYQIANQKSEHEKKEALIQEQIQETHDRIIKAHMELAQTKVDNSLDKEKTFTELKKLATAIVESREQMQAIKQTELTLRQHILNYDEKFGGLQTALKETNAAYDGFKGDMEKLAEKAKTLEADAAKWQKRFEESNAALVVVEKSHARLQTEMDRTSMNLQKMTSLYKALQSQQIKVEADLDPAKIVAKQAAKEGSNNAPNPDTSSSKPTEPAEVAVPPSQPLPQKSQTNSESGQPTQVTENVLPQKVEPATPTTPKLEHEAGQSTAEQQPNTKAGNKKRRKGKN